MGAGDALEEWEEELEKGLEEGGERGGEEVRREAGVPEEAQARKKWFLHKERTEEWVWEKGTVYGIDFFNPYLDFNGSRLSFSHPIQPALSFFVTSLLAQAQVSIYSNSSQSKPEFSLKLPGFSLSILKYLAGDDYLR